MADGETGFGSPDQVFQCDAEGKYDNTGYAIESYFEEVITFSNVYLRLNVMRRMISRFRVINTYELRASSTLRYYTRNPKYMQFTCTYHTTH